MKNVEMNLIVVPPPPDIRQQGRMDFLVSDSRATFGDGTVYVTNALSDGKVRTVYSIDELDAFSRRNPRFF